MTEPTKKIVGEESFNQVLNVCPEYSLGEDQQKNLRIRVDSGIFMDSCYSYSMIMPIPQVDGKTVLDYNVVVHQLIRNGILVNKDDHSVLDAFKEQAATPILLHIYKSLQQSEGEESLLELS